MEKDKISIIMTHWAMNTNRSDWLRRSLESIWNTVSHLPVELIVVDNGDCLRDSLWLLDCTHNKKIQHYIRNSENLYFGFGRNQGLDIACGKYVVITDNDIEYKKGWLDKCIKILEAFPDKKIAVTPLRTDRQHRNMKHWKEWFELDGERFPANTRAGSNSWVMKREEFDKVGRFRNHHVAGTKWTDAFMGMGYLMVTMETDPLATDIGFKRGYNIKMKATIARKFLNGESLIINN